MALPVLYLGKEGRGDGAQGRCAIARRTSADAAFYSSTTSFATYWRTRSGDRGCSIDRSRGSRQGCRITSNLWNQRRNFSALSVRRTSDCATRQSVVDTMLTYGFDLLFVIYEEEGYAPSEILALILRHNLSGIEIDARAAQLAALALTLKGREKSTRILPAAAIRSAEHH